MFSSLPFHIEWSLNYLLWLTEPLYIFLWPLPALLVLLYSPSCSFCSGHTGFSIPPVILMHCCRVHWHLWFSLFGQLFNFPSPLQVFSKLATFCYSGPRSNNLLSDNHLQPFNLKKVPHPDLFLLHDPALCFHHLKFFCLFMCSLIYLFFSAIH